MRYRPDHEILEEWVYNDADIDGAKVVWARDMGTAKNQELLDYYKDRRVWLVEPLSYTTPDSGLRPCAPTWTRDSYRLLCLEETLGS